MRRKPAIFVAAVVATSLAWGLIAAAAQAGFFAPARSVRHVQAVAAVASATPSPKPLPPKVVTVYQDVFVPARVPAQAPEVRSDEDPSPAPTVASPRGEPEHEDAETETETEQPEGGDD